VNEKGPLFVSVVIPLYNERESVAQLHKELQEALGELGRPSEIIYVDDGSRDGTLESLKMLQGARVISFSRNFGKSKAMEKGFAEARGEYILTLDGDLQDDPREIPKFLEALEQGSDLVVGWKVDRRDPFEKRFVSKVANGLARALAGSAVHDMNCGFKGFRAEVAKSLRFYGDMHRYVPAVVSALGYKVTEVPVAHRARKYGRSKYGAWRLFAGFFDLLTLLFVRRFFDRPMHFFGLWGVGAGFVGGLILIYLTWIKFAAGETIGNRPLLFLGILLVVIGFQLLSLGLLGELVVRQKSGETVPVRYRQ